MTKIQQKINNIINQEENEADFEMNVVAAPETLENPAQVFDHNICNNKR